MIDIKFIRETPKLVEENMKKRGFDIKPLKMLEELDKKRSFLIHQKIEPLRQKRNKIAEEVASGKKDERLVEEGRIVKNELQGFKKDLEDLEIGYQKLLYEIPNLMLEDIPSGDASKNKIIKQVGKPKKFSFKIKDHVELGQILDLIDIERASKISGSRFSYLKNQLVILELALVQLALNKLVSNGFTPIIPPALIKKEITDGLGYWHGKIDERHTSNENYYLVYDPEEDTKGNEISTSLYLIGTGEHAIVPMFKNETIEGKELPLKYAAFSPCFRREAGTYGKDTKGILRQHQFDKVEMVCFVKPEDDEKERGKMLFIAEDLVTSLELPYRLVKLASGDLGFPSAETIDIETWIPSQNKYRETHSVSTTTDFQSRRLNIRFKTPQPGSMMLTGVGGGSRTEFVHILNGTAFAIGRTLIAIMENYQQKDGSIQVPKVLQKYTGFSKIPA